MLLVLLVCGLALDFVFELLSFCGGLGLGLGLLLRFFGLVSWSMPVAVEGLVVRQAKACQLVASGLERSICIA